MSNETNPVALVTAAGRGIGAGIARVLARRGWRVAVMSPSERCEAVADELGGLAVRGSVLDEADLRRLVDAALDRWGRIDAAVYNMGHGGGLPKIIDEIHFSPDRDEPLLDLPDELWHESLDMYLLGVVRLARLLTPLMVEAGGGSIVAVSSVNAVEPRPMYPMSALRGALHVFVKAYADRYARDKVRMNAVMPGFCENVALSEDARRRIPIGRPARFEEIGEACHFLASPAASYITGQSLLVDGGINRGVH
ncbi:MAG: SDR family oxidoreductase [Kiloniellales bacterium]|nr:SDR family oxidoreductase [Kiloniellales bacterium]